MAEKIWQWDGAGWVTASDNNAAQQTAIDISAAPMGDAIRCANPTGPRPTSRADVLVIWTNAASQPLNALSGDWYLTAPAASTVWLDSFTGSDGAAWNVTNWGTGSFTTGASATIQTNRGRLNTGSATTYSGRSVMPKAGADVTDGEWRGTVRFNNGNAEGGLELWFRANALSPTTGYFGRIHHFGGASGLSIGKGVTGTYTTLAQQTRTWIDATDYKFRCRVEGTAISIKVWDASTTEPGTWDLTTTDSAVTAAGKALVMATGGNAGGVTIDVDDVSWNTTAAGGSPTLNIVP